MLRYPALFRPFLRTFKVTRFFSDVVKTEEVLSKKEKEEIPVHLRPYDKEKYEIPSTKLKRGSGYSLLDIEAMPRAKIMKICYIILERLKEVPETALYRIYTEEKIKYIMRLTDEIEDVRKLEEELGHDTIEFYIQSLNKELTLLEHVKIEKPWECKPENLDVMAFAKQKRSELKHLKYDKPNREQAKFIETK